MLQTVKGSTSYLILNAEGIPLKKSNNITPEKALQNAALVQDLWNVTRKVVVNDLKAPDVKIEGFRMRWR